MKRAWILFLSILLLPLLAGGGIYTNAFFFDGERSDGNVLASSYLDAEVAGGPLSGPICAAGGGSGTELIVRNAGAFEFFYDVDIENATGTGCASAALEAYRNDALLYDGPLADFSFTDGALEKDADDTWRVKVKFPSLDAVGSCQFETVFSAQQGMFASGEAFYDRESLTHSVEVGDEAFCGPRVNLNITKAISGDRNGFELSDFSYRVTGDGVDTIVPHDGIVRLPTGVYSIEELVPEGFVKDDWRIGWYGQCEAGDTFSTTITIDEGNVDHGTLYCQADNQYRPELNESSDEAIEADTASTSQESQSRETRDTERTSRREPARGTESGEVTGEATTTETVLVSKENLRSDESETKEAPQAESGSSEPVVEETESSSKEELTEEVVQPEADELVEEEPEEPVTVEPDTTVEETASEETTPLTE